MHLPVPYDADRHRAEQILLAVADKHTVKIAEMSQAALNVLEHRYLMKPADLKPQTYWRLTDNWLEMTVRFIVPDAGIRQIKSQMSREILAEFDKAGIGIASDTYDIVGLPPIKVQMIPSNGTAVKTPSQIEPIS